MDRYRQDGIDLTDEWREARWPDAFLDGLKSAVRNLLIGLRNLGRIDDAAHVLRGRHTTAKHPRLLPPGERPPAGPAHTVTRMINKAGFGFQLGHDDGISGRASMTVALRRIRAGQ